MSHRVLFTPGRDGFTIVDVTRSIPIGTELPIRYITDDVHREITVPFLPTLRNPLSPNSPPRQLFVFTGTQPTHVELMDSTPYTATGILFRPDKVHIQLNLRSWFSQSLPLRAVVSTLPALAEQLAASRIPVYLLYSGGWLAKRFPIIPKSATGKPLLAFGACPTLPGITPKCLYLEVPTAHALAELLLKDLSFDAAVAALSQDNRFRTVHIPGLDHGLDSNLRVLQLITGLQTGGAERLMVDLSRSLVKQKHQLWIATLVHSRRQGYPPPAPVFDLSPLAHDPVRLAAHVRLLVQHHGIDIVHGHLLNGPRTTALVRAGIPLVITHHNMPAGWPPDVAEHLKAHAPDLLIACSNTVEAASSKMLATPTRTAWNTIDPTPFTPSTENLSLAREWREQNGWKNDLVVITIANPRTQKNLPRIPRVLAALQTLVVGQTVRLLLIGQAVDPESNRCLTSLRTACKRNAISLTEITHTNPALYLHASDLYLSTSHYEGLSLAQLEALASGLPVIVTDVGAAQEIRGEMQDPLFYVPLSKTRPDADFAQALLTSFHHSKSIPRASQLPGPFQLYNATRRNRQLYYTALSIRAAKNKPRSGIWLVTDNFVMGGAQSSARRLLGALHSSGHSVQAFTVHEGQPTLGTEHLRSLGIPVTAFPPHPHGDARTVAASLLDRAVEHPPRAIFFWNLICSYKITIADALADITRIIDVSPGEMYFKEFEQHFKKPFPELSYRTPAQYGARLYRFVVKYRNEAPRARETLGAPVNVIRNGVPVLEKRPPAPPLDDEHPFMIGTAARISPDKRIEDLLEAFALAQKELPPRCQLHIAGRIEKGAETYAADLRDYARKLPVVWLGELPHTQDFLRTLHMFVMISEPAGCPNASLEALALGVPSILTDVGGAAEQVVHQKTGLLTPRRDNAALAKAMVELANSPKLQAKFRKAAPQYIAKQFSLNQMLENYKALCGD